MFAIYPAVDAENAKEHAVVFCEDIDIATTLCDFFTKDRATRHEAFLVMPSWPDPQLIHNLNGLDGKVCFSVRDPVAADRASWACRTALGMA